MRTIVATVFALLVASAAQAQAVPSVAGTTWCVRASWANLPFFWVFADGGRYKDTDGPTGSWAQTGSSLTLNADAGFVYRVTLDGDEGTGTVYSTASGAQLGSLNASRVTTTAGGTCPVAKPNVS